MKNTSVAVPEWLARNAVYQINPRTFSGEGTLSTIREELSFLRDLGFRIIYLCPIFEADESTDPASLSPRQVKSNTGNPKNPYRMKDHFFIDCEYGTAEDLKALVEAAHNLDMKILLDLVYAHVGPGATVLARHPEFAQQHPDGSFVCTKYNFPKLDFNCEGLREYLYANMMYYISAFDVDGFRLDIGDTVPVDFWTEGRRRMKAVKKDAVLINEGRAFNKLAFAYDSAYCFSWNEGLFHVFYNGEPATQLQERYEAIAPTLPIGALLLRDMDNHDDVTDRPQRMELAVTHAGMEQIEVINYLIDGIPMVYCGNELACTAKLSMFANRFYPGDFEVTDRNNKTGEAAQRRMWVFRKLNALKAESDLLRYGRTEWLDTEEKDSIVAFERVYEGEKVVFIGNTKDHGVTVPLPETAPRSVLLQNGSTVSKGEVSFGPYGYVAYIA